MKLIVGLGNIGREYERTRHNVGFMFLDHLAREWGLEFKEEKAFKGALATRMVAGEKVCFLKPSTYMNLSGDAVRLVFDYYKVGLEDVLVIYDDMDLPVGDVRYKKKGSSGGQKGMADILLKLGTDKIARLKIGIGKGEGPIKGKDYVLSRFSGEEQETVDALIARHVRGVELFAAEGIEKTMNEMNRKSDEGQAS